jgi:hypothetical protein
MSKPGISKALDRELRVGKVVAEEKHFCPNRWCKEVFPSFRKLREHYSEAHKCGRCNEEKHKKCKQNECGCMDAMHKDRDINSLNKILIIAAIKGRRYTYRLWWRGGRVGLPR